jgi:hypothetical protein
LVSMVSFWSEVWTKSSRESIPKVFICNMLSRNATQLPFQQTFPVWPAQNRGPYHVQQASEVLNSYLTSHCTLDNKGRWQSDFSLEDT